jgi:ribonuclease E
MDSASENNTDSVTAEAVAETAGESHRRRPADKRNEGRRRRRRQADESEAATTEVLGSIAETTSEAMSSAPAEQAAPAVEVASSEALSAAFAEPEADTLEVEALSETASEEASAAEANESPKQPQTEVTTSDPAAEEEAPAVIETEDTVLSEASDQHIHSTAGVNEAGRAVNDPRVAPKPVTETKVSTEQGQLFWQPEAPPVTIVEQNVPRASNDPRGPRAA